MVIIFLCAALNFGNSFVANSPAPLQSEIEEHLNITDTQFNMYYSIKSFSSMITPFGIALSLNSLGLKPILIFLAGICALGQLCFVYGLMKKEHTWCLAGRFLIGLSDSQTIMQ